jgi:hypothetical protein
MSWGSRGRVGEKRAKAQPWGYQKGAWLRQRSHHHQKGEAGGNGVPGEGCSKEGLVEARDKVKRG